MSLLIAKDNKEQNENFSRVDISPSCLALLIAHMNYSPSYLIAYVILLNTSITIRFQRENCPAACGLFSFSMKAEESIEYFPEDLLQLEYYYLAYYPPLYFLKRFPWESSDFKNNFKYFLF